MLKNLLFSIVFGAAVICTHGYTVEEVEDFVRDAHNHAAKKVRLPDSYNETIHLKLGEPSEQPIEGQLFLEDGWLTGLSSVILKGPVDQLTLNTFKISIYFSRLRIDYKYKIVVVLPINAGRTYGDLIGVRAAITVRVIGKTFALDAVDNFEIDNLTGSFYDSDYSPFHDVMVNNINESQKSFLDLLAELIEQRFARISCEHMVDLITAAAA